LPEPHSFAASRQLGPLATDEHDAAQNVSVINPPLPVALRKMGLKTRHLFVRKPE
jgi:hypothetical protein